MRFLTAILCAFVFVTVTPGGVLDAAATGISCLGQSCPARITQRQRVQAAPGMLPADNQASQASGSPISQPSPQAGDQAKNLLRKVYMVTARIRDLLSVTQAANWKMTDAERSQFQEEVSSVGDQLQTLEKWRYQFFYHPEDTDAAGKTLESLRGVIPAIGQIAKDAREYGGGPAAAPLKQPLDDLSGLRDNLASYLEAQFPGKFPQAETAPPAVAAAQSQPAAAPAGPTQQAVRAGQASQAAPPAHSLVTTTSEAPGASQPAPAAAPQAPPSAPANASTGAQEPPSQPAQPNQQQAAAANQSAPPQAATTPAAAAAPKPDQVKALLRNVYLTDARVSDLLSLLQPGQWKMSDSERALFNERLQAVRNQLTDVEKWRYQFLYHMDKTDLGEKTVSALGDLVPGILGVKTTVAQYQGQAAGEQFAQAAGELATSRNTLASYVAFAEAQVQKELAAPPKGLPGQKGLETERVNAAPTPPPVSSLAVAPPPLTPGQVKSILYKVYISEFRIRDLLGQERPDQWKGASPAERTMAAEARTALVSRLNELEKWRVLFSGHPGNMYDAFQTYRSVNALFHPLRVFGLEAGKYESESMANDYSQRETDMEAQLNGLIPYISFILQNQDRNLEMFQTDLSSCQNQLGYAMHSMVHTSQPMKNIVPVFQGRRRNRQKSKSGQADKRDAGKKSAIEKQKR